MLNKIRNAASAISKDMAIKMAFTNMTTSKKYTKNLKIGVKDRRKILKLNQ